MKRWLWIGIGIAIVFVVAIAAIFYTLSQIAGR
jgi:hypothetical protein